MARLNEAVVDGVVPVDEDGLAAVDVDVDEPVLIFAPLASVTTCKGALGGDTKIEASEREIRRMKNAKCAVMICNVASECILSCD